MPFHTVKEHFFRAAARGLDEPQQTSPSTHGRTSWSCPGVDAWESGCNSHSRGSAFSGPLGGGVSDHGVGLLVPTARARLGLQTRCQALVHFNLQS